LFQRIHVDPSKGIESTPFPFKVYTCNDLIKADNKNRKYQGFLVTGRFDVGDMTGFAGDPDKGIPGIERFPFKAYIHKDHKNIMVVEAPFIDATDRGCDDVYIRAALREDRQPQFLMDALDNGRQHYEDTYGLKEPPTKTYWLQFPSGTVLSGSAIEWNNPGGKKPLETPNREDPLKRDFFRVVRNIRSKKTRDVSKTLFPRIFWVAADTSIKHQAVGASEIPKDEEIDPEDRLDHG
jgi:hypothetical protein